ncbi:hypothetical protein [Paraclostridium bifermentans]|uniref:hypothetical protein n=1 Tax=Paraclostridium bifermentans TaxID=1490 RepID=UPI00041CC3CF|nr:hypothetical protein [Paraclostridium bifermentans]
MSNNININLKEKIEGFPEDIKDIALEIVDSLNNKNKSLQTIEDMIDRRINNLVNKGM